MKALDTWIITHRDADGICSAAITLAARPNARIYFSHPIGLYRDLEKPKKGDEVFIFDISLAEDTLHKTFPRLADLSKQGSVTYIDHHPLPPNVTREMIPCITRHSTEFCATELAYREFREIIPSDMSRVAIYGAIGDYKEKTTLMQQLIEDWDKSALYYETGTLLEGLEIDRKDYDFMRRIALLLSKNMPPSSDNELVSRARQQAQLEEEQRKNVTEQVKTIGNIAYVIDVPGSIGTAALYARVTEKALIGVAGATKHEIVDLSLRSKNPKINLNILLRSECRKFGGVGGGHPQAAGARIPIDQLIAFLKSLDLTTTAFLEQ